MGCVSGFGERSDVSDSYPMRKPCRLDCRSFVGTPQTVLTTATIDGKAVCYDDHQMG